jgi:hypothetical protein
MAALVIAILLMFNGLWPNYRTKVNAPESSIGKSGEMKSPGGSTETGERRLWMFVSPSQRLIFWSHKRLRSAALTAIPASPPIRLVGLSRRRPRRRAADRMRPSAAENRV